MRLPVERALDEAGPRPRPARRSSRSARATRTSRSASRRDGLDGVLRRPPRPPLAPSAHDVLREARILRALERHAARDAARAPRARRPDALGVPFFVMESMPGVALTDSLPGVARSATAARGARRRPRRDAVRGARGRLARRRAGRARAARRLPRAAAPALPRPARADADAPAAAAVELADWLERHRPEQRETTLVHGDFRLGNVLVAAGPGAGLGACSTGSSRRSATRSPTSATSRRHGASRLAPGNALELSPVTRAPGFPTRAELVARYAARSGRDARRPPLVHGARALEGRDLPRGELPAPDRRQTDDPYYRGLDDGRAGSCSKRPGPFQIAGCSCGTTCQWCLASRPRVPR